MAGAARPGRNRRQKDSAQADPVAREVNDILQKYLTRGVSGPFLRAFGIDMAPIVEVLPSELPVLAVRLEQPDRFFRLADTVVVDLEFQTTSEESDLERFYDYQFAARKEYKTKVYTIVLYGPGIASANATLDTGSAIFTVQNVFIGQWDGEAVVTQLRERIEQGEDVGEELLTRLKLLPLMKHQRPLAEVVREVAALTSGLPKATREETIGTMLGLGYNYLEPTLIEQLLKEPTVANALEQLVRDSLIRGKLEGREEGRVKGQHEAILSFLAGRFGEVPCALQERILGIVDLGKLQALVKIAATAGTLEEFAQALAAANGA